MTSKVFTIFFHGTAFNRKSDRNELINQLSHNIRGEEAVIVQTQKPTREDPLPYRLKSANPSYLLCEGPGSDPIAADSTGEDIQRDRPGVFNPLLNVQKNPGKSHELNPTMEAKGGLAYWILGDRKSSGFQDDFMGNTAGASYLGGLMRGSGWDDNVYKAVWMLTHLKFAEDMPIETVNLVGWSRGAVTCIKTANKIFEVFEDTIDVNIFAIDPVPGGINWHTDDIKFLPPNVPNFVAALALDENGNMFGALDRSTIKLMAPRSQHGRAGNPDSRNPTHLKPKVHFLPFPGNHADVSNTSVSSKQVKGSGALIKYLAWQFLSSHGTVFKDSFGIAPDKTLEIYQHLMTDMPEIARQARTRWVGSHGIQSERAVSTHRGDYVSEPQTYINEHHRMLALGADYPKAPAQKEVFVAEDWTDWNANQVIDDWNEWSGGKSLDLLEGQSHLGTMGF